MGLQLGSVESEPTRLAMSLQGEHGALSLTANQLSLPDQVVASRQQKFALMSEKTITQPGVYTVASP
jgi:hypothetical protein